MHDWSQRHCTAAPDKNLQAWLCCSMTCMPARHTVHCWPCIVTCIEATAASQHISDLSISFTDAGRHAQTADDLKPKSSQSSFSGLGWGSGKAAAGGIGVEASSSSFPGSHGSPGADSRDGDRPSPPADMPALLCEDRLNFQHVFEDAVPGMPSARATFQVRVIRLLKATSVCSSPHPTSLCTPIFLPPPPHPPPLHLITACLSFSLPAHIGFRLISHSLLLV